MRALMRTKTVERTSVFPAECHEVFKKLQRLDTLQEVAWPYATFSPADGVTRGTWEEGATSSYRFRLFGLIPFGTHTIHVVRFDEAGGIYTQEGNEHVPVWNHEITLRELPGGVVRVHGSGRDRCRMENAARLPLGTLLLRASAAEVDQDARGPIAQLADIDGKPHRCR